MFMATKTTTPPAEPEAFVRIRTLTPVRYDGQDMAEAQLLELNASAADALVAAGLAEPVPAEPEPPEVPAP
jgi:hypothetical protein